MDPAMRATADRLILDVANLKYFATTLKAGDLERTRGSTAWTVRQTIGHLARSLKFVADGMPALLVREPSRTVPDWDALNAESARATATTPLPEMLAMVSEARDRLVAAFLALTPEQLEREVVPGVSLRAIILSWQPHLVTHALDLLDTLADACLDPMLLNWVLYADFRHAPELAVRQQKLMAEVRERLATPQEAVDGS